METLICVLWLCAAYYLVWAFAPPGFNAKYSLIVYYAFGPLFSKVTLLI